MGVKKLTKSLDDTTGAIKKLFKLYIEFAHSLHEILDLFHRTSEIVYSYYIYPYHVWIWFTTGVDLGAEYEPDFNFRELDPAEQLTVVCQ